MLAFGGVDLVVNNAGLSISKPLLETTVADWDLQHDVMAKGSFLVSREAARVMIDQAMGGDLVYIVSKNAFFAGPNNVAYGAAKADQAHQVRLLAAELGEFGIRVNGVNPDGVVRGSGIFAKGWGADRARTYGIPEDKLGEFYAQRTLLKREVLPEHVAAAVFALTGGDLSPDHRPAHPGRRRRRGGVPALTRRGVAARRGRPGRARAAGSMVGRVGPRTRSSSTEVHRFPNEPVALPDGLHWDVRGLYREILAGLREAARGGRTAGRHRHRLLGRRLRPARRDGRLLGDPVPLPRRADARGRWRRVARGRPARELYARTGLQFLPFNTLYQLAAPDARSAALGAARTMLLIPDLLGFWLTGGSVPSDQRLHHRAARRADAAVGRRSWSRRSACRRRCCRRSATPGDVVGPLRDASPQTGPAPATAGDPRRLARHRVGGGRRARPTRRRFAYISCGTWSLVGLELDAPVLTRGAAGPRTSPTRAASTARSASCAT